MSTLSYSNECIVATGAEMQSRFSFYSDRKIKSSRIFGNSSDFTIFSEYKKELLEIVKNYKPKIMLSDMHPSYNTSILAEEIAAEYNIKLIKIQHHLAHAYSVAPEHELKDFSSIICDGLGYGTDGKIWGGEVFSNDIRIGHLEEHRQLGGDSAADEPAKMLISILNNFISEKEILIYLRGKYSQSELKILLVQLNDSFNCPMTSSTGRILDAASFLLGFCHRREYDGSPAIELDKNATDPYVCIPIVKNNILLTTPLFEYLIKNIDKDKKRLAATVLSYIANGLYQIAAQTKKKIVFSGGCANSRIMKETLFRKNVLLNKEISCGDAGISFGQISYYLADPRDNIS
jgi:hydrogenase maturation protein HypF